MRRTRSRAMAAGILGAAVIVLAPPASATTPNPTPTQAVAGSPASTPAPAYPRTAVGGAATPLPTAPA
ncbi:hypothetical protein MXD58_008025, partial [Frankia sp. AgKG'84/4]|nr:hypothetical protein [Frankia sp. AgKG'84/4]